MSRSNPTENNPNPSSKFFEWSGNNGVVRYYDKAQKKNIDMADGFTFILLDQLATVKGWHDSSDSGIYANEVKDIRQHSLTVKAFKGGIIAEGFYSTIKDRVIAAGGHYVANLYIALKEEGKLVLAAIQFKGAALSEWMEFLKANRKAVNDEKAVTIKGFVEKKKGATHFRVPVFYLKEISPETNAAATKIDADVLQPYLKSYFSRQRTDQVASTAKTESGEDEPEDRTDHSSAAAQQQRDDDAALDDSDDVPF